MSETVRALIAAARALLAITKRRGEALERLPDNLMDAVDLKERDARRALEAAAKDVEEKI